MDQVHNGQKSTSIITYHSMKDSLELRCVKRHNKHEYKRCDDFALKDTHGKDTDVDNGDDKIINQWLLSYQ